LKGCNYLGSRKERFLQMFGLEEQKKKKPSKEFVFELENDFKNGKKCRELKLRIESRVQKIKEVLRSGEEKEEFDRFGVLLHGYTALVKVMARFSAK